MPPVKIMLFGLLSAACVCATLGADRPVIVPGRPTVLYIVRHAEKVDASRDSDLSELGKRRAQTLAWMLRDVKLDAVYSTDFRRTKGTVQPTADSKGLEVQFYGPGEFDFTRPMSGGFRGKTVLVCGHSNTIPQLLTDLGVGIEEEVLAGFDNLFVVIRTHDRIGRTARATLQRLHYPAVKR